MKSFLLILLAYFSIIGNIYSGIIEVPKDYPTIQQALDSAIIHIDTVLVCPGTYYENLSVTRRLGSFDRIVLTSLFYLSSNKSHVDSTILDGEQNGSIISISGCPLEIIGFTFQNGKSSSDGAISSVGSFEVVNPIGQSRYKI